MTNDKSGVALIEILISVVVAGILIVGAATLISVTLGLSRQNKFLQAASFLSQDLMDKVTVFAEKKWLCDNKPPPPISCGIYQLDKGLDNPYHFIIAGSAFSAKFGKEDITPPLDGILYTRYFYLENICRDASGNIAGITDTNGSAETCNDSGGSPDSSTQKVTVVTVWPGSEGIRLVKFLTRHANKAFVQTDWSGKGNQALNGSRGWNAETEVNFFDKEENINFDEAGKIKIK